VSCELRNYNKIICNGCGKKSLENANVNRPTNNGKLLENWVSLRSDCMVINGETYYHGLDFCSLECVNKYFKDKFYEVERKD